MPTTTAPTGPQPTIRVAGKFLAITDTSGELGYFLRDQVVTAYLLILDHQDEQNIDKSVVRRLEIEHGVLHHDAVRAMLAASLLVRHNLEP